MAITHMSAHVALPRSSLPKERVPFFFKALLRSTLGAGGEDEDVRSLLWEDRDCLSSRTGQRPCNGQRQKLPAGRTVGGWA